MDLSLGISKLKISFTACKVKDKGAEKWHNNDCLQ